jgi:hypothetical protein
MEAEGHDMLIFNARAVLMMLLAAAFAFGAVTPALGVPVGNVAFSVLLAGLDLTYRLNFGGDEGESTMSRLVRPRAGGFVWPMPVWSIGVGVMILHATKGAHS